MTFACVQLFEVGFFLSMIQYMALAYLLKKCFRNLLFMVMVKITICFTLLIFERNDKKIKTLAAEVKVNMSYVFAFVVQNNIRHVQR